jgi:1-pyrroline-5-carboxylate dehydrogenase
MSRLFIISSQALSSQCLITNKALFRLSFQSKARQSSQCNGDYKAQNEPIYEYARGSKEREKLNEALKRALSSRASHDSLFEVPIIIGDKEIKTNNIKYQLVPFEKKTKLVQFYHADKSLITEAIKQSLSASQRWESVSVDERARILLKAADMLAGAKRYDILAATILGQGKTVYQAEIDAACELIDFLRFNVQFMYETIKYKPLDVGTHTINSMSPRGLEGFVAAIAPFNFTAIGGNLCTAPALMGNVVLWKPSDTAVLSSYVFYKVLREAGLPEGVVNFVPAGGPEFGEVITKSPHLAAINFTGSVPTFRWLWKNVGANLELYKTFPRLSGECGGKNFHLMHESADLESFCIATIRSAYEYSGQKCSACSRLYVPESKWPHVRDRLTQLASELKIDSPLKFETFTSAVIDETSFDRIKSYIDYGINNKNIKTVFGGLK